MPASETNLGELQLDVHISQKHGYPDKQSLWTFLTGSKESQAELSEHKSEISAAITAAHTFAQTKDSAYARSSIDGSRFSGAYSRDFFNSFQRNLKRHDPPLTFEQTNLTLNFCQKDAFGTKRFAPEPDIKVRTPYSASGSIRR